MPVQFDAKGNPSPYAIIAIDMVRFEQIFSNIPDIDIRTSLLDNLRKYIEDFNSSITPNSWVQWFGGSYTTTKREPNDIDLINFIDPDSADLSIDRIWDFITNGENDSKAIYSIDGYLVPLFGRDDPRHDITVSWCEYWQKWFGSDRDANPKAIIKVIQK